MDVGEMCALLGVTSVPKFNGGLYYFRRSATAAAVFEYARSLIRRYDELGLRAFRGGASDEPLLAIALATHGIAAVDDGGTAMRTPIGIEGALDMDVFSGRCRFVKEGHTVSPAIVHFAGDFAETSVYRRERAKLRHALDPLRIRARCMADMRCRRERQAMQHDATAIAELERLRAEGATHLCIGWPSFWWLGHYTGFAAHVRARYRCLQESRALILFDLRVDLRAQR